MRNSRNLKTKIVCTIGPASADLETLRRMAEAGMNVVRINTSHSDIDDVRRYVDAIRETEVKTSRRIGVMLDLQGPRLRVGSIQGSSTELVAGQDFTITTEQKRGDSERVSVSYSGLPEDLESGDFIYIDDGLIKMKVKRVEGPEIHCEVLEGGTLLQGKGMNFPGVRLGLPSFTDRDGRYLEAGLKAGIDWISQSFVREADDVRLLRDAVEELGYETPIMVKVEKREAVENIGSIMKLAQGVMVARGDLGVEMETEEVPLVQKRLIRDSLKAAKPVVTATQMLETMVENPRPTRAEASDVANAIWDGTDALMLSAETAIGAYPVRAVETMVRIAARAEREIDYGTLLEERGRWEHRSAADAIGYSACKMAADMGARAIVTITRSGYTAALIARYRPAAEILAVSPDEMIIDRMSLVWGVSGMVSPMADGFREMVEETVQACLAAGLVDHGDLLVITGGFIGERVGTTNTISLKLVE